MSPPLLHDDAFKEPDEQPEKPGDPPSQPQPAQHSPSPGLPHNYGCRIVDDDI